MSNPAPVLRFGRFELQPAEHRLLADGRDSGLRGRALEVLRSLIGRAGHLVTRSELLDLAWPGLVVEENNLSVQISALRKVLGGEIIATVPGRGYRFTAQLDADPAPAATQTPSPPGDTVPAPLPRLIGRDEDLAQLSAALQQPGLLTLTGPAGVGKTSLARGLAAGWPAGAVWVDLAPARSEAQLEAAAARALGLSTPEGPVAAALAQALGERLLVLDNAEHLIDAAAALAAALRHAAPGCHVLATSQLPLALPGEQVRRIAPLELSQGAVSLFVERARAADHRFTVAPDAWPLVHAICRGLDGLPLALEMAAARVPALGLSGVNSALDQRFALLTTGYRHAAGRHRTLHAALDWSHDLLGPEEQRVFRACGVFAGGFTLELLVAVAAAAPDERWPVIDALATLADRSLVATDPQDPPRYRLLETLRAYALEKLAASGEEQPLRQRQAMAMGELFAAAAQASAKPAERAAALAEHDNAREAIAWAIQHEPALAVQLAPDVCSVASYVSWRREAFEWLEASAAVIDEPRVGAARRAGWWYERARQQVIGGHSQARASAQRACDLWQALGDDLRVFNATAAWVRAGSDADDDLHAGCDRMQALLQGHPEWDLRSHLALAGARAWACSQQADWEGVLRHRLEEAALARRAQQPGLADAAESNIVAALHRLGRHGEALDRNTRLLARLGDAASINAAYTWVMRIGLLVDLGRFGEARAALAQAGALMRRFDVVELTLTLALMAALEDRPRSATQLLGHYLHALAARGRTSSADSRPTLERVEARVRSRLDDTSFDVLLAAGAALPEADVERLAAGIGDAA